MTSDLISYCSHSMSCGIEGMVFQISNEDGGADERVRCVLFGRLGRDPISKFLEVPEQQGLDPLRLGDAIECR